MRQFLVFPYPEEAGLAPSGAARVARDGKDEKTAPTEAVGCILTAGREGKMGILVQLLDHSAESKLYLQALRSESQTAAQEHCHA
jgi:hypothetical protein